MSILVTGATGSVGKQIVKQLSENGKVVKAMTSSNRENIFEKDIELVKGNLDSPESVEPHLKNIDSLFLLLRSDDSKEKASTNKEIIKLAEKANVRKLVVLMDKQDEDMTDFIKNCHMKWTIILPVEFMKNVVYEWKYTILTEQKVYTAFPQTPSAKVHELDVADVSAKVLLEDDVHNGKIYVLTGPEILTPETVVRKISTYLNADIELVIQSEDELRNAWIKQGFEKDFVNYYIIELGKNPRKYSYTITSTIEEILKKPARTFDQWLTENKSFLEA